MEGLKALNNLLRSVIAAIGNTQVFGITLDIPAHLLGAATIYYLLASRKIQTRYSVAIVLLLEAGKEFYDSSALLHHGQYIEPVKDVFFTCLGVWLGHYLSGSVKEHKKAPEKVR